MNIKHQFSVLCEDVRTEQNGKFILIGVLPGDITFASFPSGFEKLCLFQYLLADGGGKLPFKLDLISARDGKVRQTVTGEMNIVVPGLVYGTATFRYVEVSKPGAYRIRMKIGETRPFVVKEFKVVESKALAAN